MRGSQVHFPSLPFTAQVLSLPTHGHPSLTAPSFCVIGSTVSISTALTVSSERVVAETADTIINLNRRRLQDHWSDVDHLQEIDSGWVVSGFHLLMTFLTVGTALVRECSSDQRRLHSGPVVKLSSPLEPRVAVECLAPCTAPTLLLTFPVRGLIEAGPGIPIAAPTTPEKAHPQPHRIIAWTTLFSVEGFQSLEPCSKTSDCGDAVKWAIVFTLKTSIARPGLPPTSTPASPPMNDSSTSSSAFPGDNVTESDEEEVAAIIPRPTHVPVTPVQPVPNTELEASLELAPFKDSTEAREVDAQEYTTSATPAVSPPPRFNSNPEAPILDPSGQAVAASGQLLPALYNLATRAEQRSRPWASAWMQSTSAESHVEDRPPASATEEDGSAAHAQAENASQTGQKRTKRGGNREARRKPRLATKAVEGPEAGPSGSK
ncbi:hypothetical protein FRC01_002743 [Tulasnella sp. 417]|nr:hypothetical protein FRC01_002743 [Tulasnella sp. 417]